MDVDAIVRAELVRQKDDARATIHRGILLIALVPIITIVALGLAASVGSVAVAVLAMMGAATYAIVGGIGGLAMLAAGTVESRRLARQLRVLDEPRQLPAARVIVR